MAASGRYMIQDKCAVFFSPSQSPQTMVEIKKFKFFKSISRSHLSALFIKTRKKPIRL